MNGCRRSTRTRLLWGAPLMRTKFRKPENFFARLRSDLAAGEPGKAAWIVGLGDPWEHWTVVDHISDRTIYFFDSWGMKHYRFDSFTLDAKKAGDEPGQKIMIDTHQSFLLRVGEL